MPQSAEAFLDEAQSLGKAEDFLSLKKAEDFLEPPAPSPEFTGATLGSPIQPLTAPYSEYQQRVPAVSPLTGEKIPSTGGPSLNPLEPILSNVIPRYTPGPPQLFGPPSKAESIAGGTYNALAGLTESATSPAVLLSGGLGEAAPVLQRPVAALWTLIMGKEIPKQIEQVSKVFKEDRPLNEKVEAAESLAASLAFIGAAGKHALVPEKIGLTPEQVSKAQEQARLSGLPSQEPVRAEPTPEPKPGDIIPSTEAPKAPETPPVVPEPPPTPENAPTVPQQAPAGVPEQPVKAAEALTPEDEVLRRAGFAREEPAFRDVTGKGVPFEETVFRGTSSKTPNDAGIYSEGTHYTTSKDYADAYGEKRGGTTTQSTVSLKNAFVTTPQELNKLTHGLTPQQVREGLQAKGYDGIVIEHPDNVAAEKAAGVPDRLLSPAYGKEVIVFERPAISPSAKTEGLGRPELLSPEKGSLAVTEKPSGAEILTPISAPPSEPAISFPGIGSLREGRATAMELGKIRKAEPELWKAITGYFGETAPSKIAKAAKAAFDRQREAQSRAASAGPGAASPVEFEQRARAQGDAAAAGQKPPGDNPPVATDANQGPSIEVTRANRDYNILNRLNSGQFAFWFGKLGQAAKAAWERMALGAFTLRESVGRDVRRYVDGLLDSLPREFRKQGGKAFFEILDGKTLEQITDEWSMRDGGPEVIRAAGELKQRLEEIRTTIRDTRREAYNAYLNGLDRPMLEDLFRKNIDDKVDISNRPKEDLAHALARDAYRDDWGIADGSYLPHLFFGNWKVTVTDKAGNSQFVTRSRTPQEAKAEIYKFVTRNPELKDANFKVEQDTVVPADMIRLGDRRFWNLVSKMKEATGLSEGEIREAQQGIIGKKSSKQKWWGSLQKREGYQGYSQDFRQAMGAYLNGFHRWVELSRMQREVQPMIDQVRREGRPNAANRLEELMENMWGKPARSTLEFDALVRQIPGLRDFIKPMALERWSRNIRSLVSTLLLSTPRFAVLNRLQPLQGLYPIVGERIFAQAKIAQHTKGGRALLDEAGVTFDPGQFRAETSFGGKLTRLRERLSGERSNQEVAFLAMYQHGIEQGMAKPEAIQYAKLRGQLFTQFTPIIPDTPQIMEGPFGGLLFQYKRFPIKQVELLTRLVQEKRVGGIARFLAVMAITGGASYFLRQFYANPEKKKRLRDTLAEQTGEKVADGIMYGAPGLVGADLSGSLIIGDEPMGQNIYEKVGRSVAGPTVGLAVDTATALAKEKREPTTLKQDAVTLLRRFPTLRPLGELLSVDDLDVRTPDGEVAYRKKLKDAIVGMGSFRSANESNIRLAVDAMFELKKEMSQLKNAYFVANEGQGSIDKAQDAIDKFNDRWPELEITSSDLSKYVQYRRKGADKTDVERISGKKLRSLVPE